MLLKDVLIVLSVSLSGFFSITFPVEDECGRELETPAQESDFHANWINDSLGCNGFRMTHVAELNGKAHSIVGQPYSQIVRQLGKPNMEQSSNRGINIAIYTLDCTNLSLIKHKLGVSKIAGSVNDSISSEKGLNILLVEIKKGKCERLHVIKS